jgi:hypothetical protein
MKPVEDPVNADKSVGALQTQTLPNGQKQAVLTVTGVKGQAGTVVKTGAAGAVTESAAPELGKLVNAALAAG